MIITLYSIVLNRLPVVLAAKNKSNLNLLDTGKTNLEEFWALFVDELVYC